MQTFTPLQKLKISVFGDLLEPVLSRKDRHAIAYTDYLSSYENEKKGKISVHVNNKAIEDLLDQGMKLSITLERLNARGVEILFPEEIAFSKSLSAILPEDSFLYFVSGDRRLLTSEDVIVVQSLKEAMTADQPVTFFVDRPMKDLLTIPALIDKICSKNLVLISNQFYHLPFRKNTSVVNQTLPNQLSNEKKKSVFISGSRSSGEVPILVQTSLKKIVNQKISILVGDSDQGIDQEICDYLRVDPYYPYVEIYTIKPTPRIPVEADWIVHQVETSDKMKGQEAQMEKDRQMAGTADWGLSIFTPTSINWRGQLQVSSGTLRNTIQMLLQKKQVKFFYWFEDECKVANLKTLHELETTLGSYKNENLSEDMNSQIKKCKGFKQEKTPVGFRYEKIMEKYQALLKKETKLMEKSQNSIDHQSLSQFQQKLLFG